MKNLIKPTAHSLALVEQIAQLVPTFHKYHHILYDIAASMGAGPLTYVEIGCYAGASACLMLQRENTRVISIDTGYPVTRELAMANIKKLNIHGNDFTYIKGDSTLISTITRLREILPSQIDILFIDGSHKQTNVILDFNNYSPMVRSGGYIVFDDYDDFRFSPGVKPAVDYLSRFFFSEYEIMQRVHNEFIIRKK